MDIKKDKKLTTYRYKLEMQKIVVAMLRILYQALRKIDDAKYGEALNKLKKL